MQISLRKQFYNTSEEDQHSEIVGIFPFSGLHEEPVKYMTGTGQHMFVPISADLANYPGIPTCNPEVYHGSYSSMNQSNTGIFQPDSSIIFLHIHEPNCNSSLPAACHGHTNISQTGYSLVASMEC